MTRPQLVDLLVTAIRGVTKIEILPEQHGENLFQLGLDSVDAIEVVNRMEDALDLIVDDSDLVRFTSIDAIADYFEALPR